MGWIRDLLRQYAPKPIDLNTDRALRDSGKEGGPCAEGITAKNKLSKQAWRQVLKTIPSSMHPLPEVMRVMSSNKNYRALTEREVGAILLSKLVMGQAQLPVTERGGELHIDNRT